MRHHSPEKLRALGTLCALAAVAIAITLLYGGAAPSGWPASAQEEPKPWVMELP